MLYIQFKNDYICFYNIKNMKKALQLIPLFLFFTFLSFSQVKFNIANTPTNLAGTVYTINADPSHPEIQLAEQIALQIQVHNNTGSTKSWIFTRRKLSVPSDWTDKTCIIPGNCYLEDPKEFWSTPDTYDVADGDSIILNPDFKPNLSSAGSGRYRFYVGDRNHYDDSMDVQINFTLGLKTIKSVPTFSISPNPASDYFSINMNGNENVNVKIIDVLGNNIYNETISTNKKIDISDFKNGVYFVTVQSSELKITNRKLVIRH